jgi:hypothetical protein
MDINSFDKNKLEKVEKLDMSECDSTMIAAQMIENRPGKARTRVHPNNGHSIQNIK